jgi:hypothetical protein
MNFQYFNSNHLIESEWLSAIFDLSVPIHMNRIILLLSMVRPEAAANCSLASATIAFAWYFLKFGFGTDANNPIIAKTTMPSLNRSGLNVLSKFQRGFKIR